MKQVRSQVSVDKTLLEGQVRDLTKHIEDLENRLVILNTEVNRLTLLAAEKSHERDQLAARALELERELERLKSTVELQIRHTLVSLVSER